MSVKITYFVHGTTTDNEQHISTGWDPGELSELGKKQMRELGEQYAQNDFVAVFCSDLKRAKDSAEIAFGNKNRIIMDKRLRECNYGIYNGKPSSIVEPMQEQMISEKFPEGESYEDVQGRIKDFLDMLKKDYEGKSVAMVSHKAPQMALDTSLKRKSWQQAFAEDWRKTKAWKPGWVYYLQ